jgi:hypothetical protein
MCVPPVLDLQASKGEAKAESKDMAQQVQPSFQLPSWDDISFCLEKVRGAFIMVVLLPREGAWRRCVVLPSLLCQYAAGLRGTQQQLLLHQNCGVA